MATSKKENVPVTKESINEDEIKNVENVEEMNSAINVPISESNPADATEVVGEESESNYKDIDAVCKMITVAKKEKDDDEEQKRKRDADNAMAVEKAKNEKAKQEEETRKINEGRIERKKMKRNATRMLFCLCTMSVVFGYVVAGILVHIIFDPKVWIFVGVIGIFGMVNTLIHTYLYRYIRKEIYRK